METIKHFFSLTADVIDIIGIIILLFGFVKLLIKYLWTEFGKGILHTPVELLQNVRREVGIYILLALDFLIASDIIQTILDVTNEMLVELSVMIVLRTGIGYFLGKEVNELEELQKKERESTQETPNR